MTRGVTINKSHGWVKLHRKMFRDEGSFAGLRWQECWVAINCIMMANHKDKTVWHRGKRVTIKRGSFITSQRILAEESLTSVQTIKTALTKLELTGFLTRIPAQPATLITVVKYNTYQVHDAPPNPDTNPLNNLVNNPPSNPPSNHKQEVKEVKNKLSPKKSASVPHYQDFISAFTEGYLAATGDKPTWGAKQGKQVKRILKSHSWETVQKKLARFFAGKVPDWISDRDLQTFETHFDKIIEPARDVQLQLVRDAPSEDEVLAMVAEKNRKAEEQRKKNELYEKGLL